jgi:hypothetical protein
LAEWQPENASERVIGTSADVCLVVGFPSNSGRAACFLPNLIYIIPLFLPETVTRSRVVTPDSAIAVSLVSTLGGGADSVRRILMIYQSQEDRRD